MGDFMGKYKIRWGKEYFKWQASVFERDGYECKKCGEKNKMKDTMFLIHRCFQINKDMIY